MHFSSLFVDAKLFSWSIYYSDNPFLRINLLPIVYLLLALNIKLGTTNPLLRSMYFILGLCSMDEIFSYFLFTTLNLNVLNHYHGLNLLLMINLTSIIIVLNFIFEELVKLILEFAELVLSLLFNLFQFFYIFI